MNCEYCGFACPDVASVCEACIEVMEEFKRLARILSTLNPPFAGTATCANIQLEAARKRANEQYERAYKQTVEIAKRLPLPDLNPPSVGPVADPSEGDGEGTTH